MHDFWSLAIFFKNQSSIPHNRGKYRGGWGCLPFDRTYEKIIDKRIIFEGMKFKKVDPKLQAIAFTKKAKSPPPDLPSAKRKGVMIFEDSKWRKLTPSTGLPLSVSISQSSSPIPRISGLSRRTLGLGVRCLLAEIWFPWLLFLKLWKGFLVVLRGHLMSLLREKSRPLLMPRSGYVSSTFVSSSRSTFHLSLICCFFQL